jgi:hypothetical protein
MRTLLAVIVLSLCACQSPIYIQDETTGGEWKTLQEYEAQKPEMVNVTIIIS